MLTWLSFLYEFVTKMWDWIKPVYDSLQGNRRLTVAVEGDGVVSTVETSGMTVGEHITRIETDGDAGKSEPTNAAPPPGVDCYARDRGVIIADKHTNGKFDKMEFTVTRKKTSEAAAGTLDRNHIPLRDQL